MRSRSTYARFGIPDRLAIILCVIALALSFAPYLSGQKIGDVVVPDLSEAAQNRLVWGGPGLFLLFVAGFFPVHRARGEQLKETSTGIAITTHGDNSPGIVHGDFTISRQIVQEYKVSKKKRWRKIPTIGYPIPNLSETSVARYFRHLFEALAVVDSYESFTVLLWLRPPETDDPCPVIYSLSGNEQVLERLVGSRKQELKWHEKFEKAGKPERMRRKEARRIESSPDLLEGWDIESDVRTGQLSNFPLPLRCTVDPARRTLSVVNSTMPESEKEKWAELDAGNYEQHLTTTSEMLRFVAAVRSRGGIKVFPEVGWLFEEYSLSKMLISVMDGEFNYGNIRINKDDDEEWDYVNLKYDKEVRGYA